MCSWDLLLRSQIIGRQILIAFPRRTGREGPAKPLNPALGSGKTMMPPSLRTSTWPGVTALPSALLQAELRAQLKAITRECPSLPGKETLAGRLQGVPCPCGSPDWLAIGEPGGTKKPPFRGAFHSPGRHQLRPWGPKALNFLSSMT